MALHQMNKTLAKQSRELISESPWRQGFNDNKSVHMITNLFHMIMVKLILLNSKIIQFILNWNQLIRIWIN